MTASVSYLPIWKKDSTPCEWFYELAEVARKYPERFAIVVLACNETKENGNTVTRTFSHGATNTQLIGLLEIAKMQTYKEMGKVE